MCVAVRTNWMDTLLQHMRTLHTHTHVCAALGGARVLILSPQCTCTEVTPQLKPHCSYRQMMAVPSHCCTLSQTLHDTQNTLWMCTTIECKLEQKRQCTCNETRRWVGYPFFFPGKAISITYIVCVRVCAHVCVCVRVCACVCMFQ